MQNVAYDGDFFAFESIGLETVCHCPVALQFGQTIQRLKHGVEIEQPL